MNTNSIFYYPYGSFKEDQSALLKAAALYFDKLYILDPLKASWNSIGPGDMDQDLRTLELAGILVRVPPEDVLNKYEQAITEAIREDMQDASFLQMCEQHGGGRWTLALAKIPKDIRNDPRFQPVDRTMQRVLGEKAKEFSDEVNRYAEIIAPATVSWSGITYDETRKQLEYRYADYPLPLGEAIMLNHALFGSLAYTGATPLTDDPFHNEVLNCKIERILQQPAISQILQDRARQRQLKKDLLAATALTDVDLGIIPENMPLDKILDYRFKNAGELAQARDQLGWTAREIEQRPWSDDFADELDRKLIPELHKQLQPAKASWENWLKVGGLAAGGVAAALTLTTTPLVPVAVAIGALGIIKDTALPGLELAHDWKQGKQDAGANGLHYFMKLRK